MYCACVATWGRVCVGWLALAAFLRSTANPFVMPRPMFWLVEIEGVGAVYENPKNVRVRLCFQIESAVRRMPRGHGWLVAL